MKTPCAGLISILLFAVIARTAAPQNESENAIRAHIEGLRSDRGHVICALFAAGDDFPKKIGRAFARTAAQIMARGATCEFPNVPA